MSSFTLKPFGDKSYRSIEDAIKELEALPDPVEDSSDKDQPDIKVATETPPDDKAIVGLESRLIDLNRSDNGQRRTQDNWITYFNDRNKIMVSMPDIYLAGKSGNQTLIENLRKDFSASWEISSTRIIYDQNSLNAQIIHYFNSKETKPIVSKQLVIPVYRETLLTEVLNDKEGLFYLQTVLGTKDNAVVITQTLQNLSGYFLDKIKVWSARDRMEYPDRGSGFLYSGGFHVSGGNFIDSVGYSRGVRISAAGATPKNKGGVQ